MLGLRVAKEWVEWIFTEVAKGNQSLLVVIDQLREEVSRLLKDVGGLRLDKSHLQFEANAIEEEQHFKWVWLSSHKKELLETQEHCQGYVTLLAKVGGAHKEPKKCLSNLLLEIDSLLVVEN